jgi:hypothetical protein
MSVASLILDTSTKEEILRKYTMEKVMVVEVFAKNQLELNEMMVNGDYLIVEDLERQICFEEMD